MIKKLCVSRHAGLKLNSIVLIQKLQIMYLDFFNPILSLLSLFDYQFTVFLICEIVLYFARFENLSRGQFLGNITAVRSPLPLISYKFDPQFIFPCTILNVPMYNRLFIFPPSRDIVT